MTTGGKAFRIKLGIQNLILLVRGRRFTTKTRRVENKPYKVATPSLHKLPLRG